MRIFKKVLCALFALLLVENVFSFALEPITYYHFLKIDEKQIAEQKREINMAFFGDSRCVRSYMPGIFEEKLSDVDACINAGINQQHMISTYYYMKDFIARNPLKYAVVCVNYDALLSTVQEPVLSKGLTMDRMHSPLNVAEYLFHNFKLRDYPNVLVSYQYRHKEDNIFQNLKAKLQPEYWQGNDTRDEIHYVDKGFATWDLAYKQGNIGTPANCSPWQQELVDSEEFGYMDKIAELCRENDIKLIFVESPISISRMYAIDGYADFHNTITEKCAKLNVPFWNLNFLKENNVSVDDTLFTDTEHLNDMGAEKISRLLSNLLKEYWENGADEENVDSGNGVAGSGAEAWFGSRFYSSFEEYDETYARVGSCDLEVWNWPEEKDQIPLEDLKAAGFDMDAYTDEDSLFVMRATSYASRKLQVEYQFSFLGEEETVPFQPYSPLQYVVIDKAGLPDKVDFRLDVRPVGVEDVNHCYRTTLD